MDKSSGEISFSEETEIDWRNNLRTFKEKVWPVLQEEGMQSMDIAYLVWHVSSLGQSIHDLEKVFRDDQSDGY